MISRKIGGLGLVVAAEFLILGGCSSTTPNDDGGAGSPSSAGSAAVAGASGSVGASGTGTSAGAAGTSPTTGGSTGGPTGGTGAGGISTGGISTGGGGTGPGGAVGGAPAGGTAGTGGVASAGAAGTGSGTCQKGQVKPAEVVIMGESFYAIAPQYIQKRIQDDARKAGSLGASDSYRNVAVSGQNMNYIATTEWTAATQGGASVKFVIMDGGGIDCLSGGSTCSTCAGTFTTLLGKMAAAGVQDVLYTRYPEPGAPPGSNASLKACLDSTMPSMEMACAKSTSPRCHWLDLRPVFVAGDTTDGLHPTQSGGDHVGDLIWSEMTKLCLAQ
jgi:hypothetical protein